MKPAQLDWRRIEAALVRVVHAYGYTLDDNRDTGDKFAMGVLMVDNTIDDLNLTELAKDIAMELQA